MSRRTYTAEEIISYYSPSELPPNFSSFGPVGNNRPDFRPLRMNNLYNITNITNVNNNKYDNDTQFAPIQRANSEQTANWEPHILTQKSPLAPFSSSNTINSIQKNQVSISPSDSNGQAFGPSTFQPDFPSVLAPSGNDQMPLNEQPQQSQLHQQAASLPPTPQIPQTQQTQQQPPQYPFMYLPPTQFYPFVNSAQPFAVYSQYPQPPQFQPAGYGRPPPQPHYSQRFAYVNQPVMPQLIQTDQMNLGIPPQPQPQLQPQPHQQPHSMDLSFNPQPLTSQYQGQPSQQAMDIDQNQFGQPQPNPQSMQQVPNGSDYDDNEDPAMLMKYDFAFPSIVSQAPADEESFGSVLHPQQQQQQHSVDKPFNPTRLSYPPSMNDIQQQQIPPQQQQSGSNDSLGFPSIIPDQDEFSPVIGPGFQQNSASSFPSVVPQNGSNDGSFPSFVSPAQQQVPSASSIAVNQGSIDSNSLDSGFSSVINNNDQVMQQGFPSIIDNQQPFSSNQTFNSMFSSNNSGFASVVSQQQPKQIQNPQQIPNSSDSIGSPSFSSMSLDAPQFQPQGFDSSAFPSIFEMPKQQQHQDEFSSVIKPHQQPQQVQQIEPTVFTFQPKKSFPISSSVPPKDTFNPQPISSHQQSPQPQPTLQPPTLQQPTLQQPPALQQPTLQQPPTIPSIHQQPHIQPQLESKPPIETPTFQPRRILDPFHSKSNGLIRSKSTPISAPIRNQNTQPPIIPSILAGAPQFQPQPPPQLQMPPPQIHQQQPIQPQIQPNPIFQPQQPQLHINDQVLVQDAAEMQKDIGADPSSKKFQPKPFNAIEVEEQKRPEAPSNDQIQPPQQQQPRQRQPKHIRKRDLPGPPFDPKPIANQFYYSPTPTPDINMAIKPRKDTFIGRRRVW